MKKTTAFLLQAFLFVNIMAQNVGIGTITPVTKLHVAGIESNIATFAGGTAMYITLSEDGFNRGYIGSYAGDPEDVDFGTYNNSPGKLHLTTGNNTPRLTIMANGNVGIGTTTPEQLFSVAGGMVIDQNNLNTGTASNMLRFGSSSGEGIGSKRNSGTNQWGLDFYTNSIHRMTIANNGNVGINVINPVAKLEIRGALGFSSTTKRWEMNYDSTNAYFYIDEFGAGRRFYIKNGGNIGIGTSNPQALLDVNGDVNIENRLMLNNSTGTAGQTLVSNGASIAPSWRNTSYSNNDRFLFVSLSNAFTGNSDTLTFGTSYAYSSAITYNNGIFTVNKAGLYQLQGFFSPFYYPATAEDATANLQLVTSNHLMLAYDQLPYAGLAGGSPIYTKTLSATITLYFTAGSTFFLQGGVGGTVAGAQRGFFAGNPLSINLVSE